MMIVLGVVFSSVFKTPFKEFVLFLFAGLVPWNFFNLLITQNAATFVTNESLIKKIYTPLFLFPLATSIAVLVESFLTSIALIFIFFIFGLELSFLSLLIFPFYVLIFIFCFGLGLVSASVTVYFRDLQHIIPIMLQGLFFVSPILYDAKRFEGSPLEIILNLNPITPFITLFRDIIYYNRMPDLNTTLLALTLTSISIMIGYLFFSQMKNKIIYKL
jgi:ABC-type polysaccharide/polyol phosphate export permease